MQLRFRRARAVLPLLEDASAGMTRGAGPAAEVERAAGRRCITAALAVEEPRAAVTAHELATHRAQIAR